MDTSIIFAPSSTKNAKGEGDPEMHPTKKYNELHFGMKLHIKNTKYLVWFTATRRLPRTRTI